MQQIKNIFPPHRKVGVKSENMIRDPAVSDILWRKEPSLVRQREEASASCDLLKGVFIRDPEVQALLGVELVNSWKWSLGKNISLLKWAESCCGYRVPHSENTQPSVYY